MNMHFQAPPSYEPQASVTLASRGQQSLISFLGPRAGDLQQATSFCVWNPRRMSFFRNHLEDCYEVRDMATSKMCASSSPFCSQA